MEALNLTRGPSMHWEVVGVKQYNTTSPPEKKDINNNKCQCSSL